MVSVFLSRRDPENQKNSDQERGTFFAYVNTHTTNQIRRQLGSLVRDFNLSALSELHI